MKTNLISGPSAVRRVDLYPFQLGVSGPPENPSVDH